MKKHGMHLLLLNVTHRPCPAMVYYGTLKKMTQTMNSLFWLAIRDLYQYNEVLEILLHRANTILVLLYFLLLVNFLNTNHTIL